MTYSFSNLRFNAPSVEKYFSYSAEVVAPITRVVPRARSGFKALAKSKLLSAHDPAPKSKCTSSIKSMHLGLLSKKLIRIVKRSSAIPLYFVPAISAFTSRDTIIQSFKSSTQFPVTICHASFSTNAVFPTPGSPTRITLRLFALRRI